MNRFPWEFTAEEFLGPRVKVARMDHDYAAARRTALAVHSAGAPRTAVGNVWVEYMPHGVLIFDQEHGGKVVGTFAIEGEWSLDEAYRGRGLATEIDAEYLCRFGKSPDTYLKEMSTLTPEAERLVYRVHALSVRKAIERGVAVEPRVIRSAAQAKERFAALRAGDDSALAHLSERERRRKQSRHHAGRYHWINVSSSLIGWLRGSLFGLGLKNFERLVVVSDD